MEHAFSMPLFGEFSCFTGSSPAGLSRERKLAAGESARHLVAEGLKPAMKVLDVGCGSGSVTRTMCKLGAKAFGVDASPERIGLACELSRDQEPKPSYFQGDACSLPFADGEFDFAWARFLFEYLPDRQAALREMIRVTRPGGRVVVADLDAQLQTFHPLKDDLAEDWSTALAQIRKSGHDPEVGRKLYGDFCAAGLRNIDVNLQSHQLYAEDLPERDPSNWSEKLRIACEMLVRKTGSVSRWKNLERTILAKLRSGDVYYYSLLITVSGEVP
jgi:SAM-dependent methyltransferase